MNKKFNTWKKYRVPLKIVHESTFPSVTQQKSVLCREKLEALNCSGLFFLASIFFSLFSLLEN